MPSARDANPLPSIRDVARLAGVSHMTVSRVLNDSPNVSEQARARVVNAIDELRFRPSSTARALAHGRTRTLGVLDATGGLLYGPSRTISAIELAGRDLGYSVMIAAVDAADLASVHSALEHLLDQDAAGVIVIGPSAHTHDAVAEAAPRVPVMTMHGTHEGDGFIGQTLGVQAAVDHLLQLGHTRIAHIAGPAEWSEAESRRRGFIASLQAAGLEPAAIVPSDWSADAGYGAGQQLLRDADATAVVCANDQIALGLLHAAAEAGIPVPGRLSIVGFDDTPESRHFSPPLTTLRQDFTEIGRRAVASIVEALAGGRSAAEHVAEPLVPELIVRASTAKFRPGT